MTVAGLVIAVAAVFPLMAIRAAAPTGALKRAWTVLTFAIVLCLSLRAIAAILKLHDEVDASDVLDAFVHTIGPSFVFGVAWLSRRTARETMRIVELERLAFKDPLTGLANRRWFDAQLGAEIEKARRLQAPLHLILIDIDRFKTVNDRFGHMAGDAVLKAFARMVAGCVRNTDIACRIGGDEFAIIVPGLDRQASTAMVERLRSAMEQARLTREADPRVRATISAGLAGLSSGDTAETLFARADDALYAVKNGGRNFVSFAA